MTEERPRGRRFVPKHLADEDDKVSREHPGRMDGFQELGNPYYADPTMPDAGEPHSATPGYVSYARPIGPGRADFGYVFKGTLVAGIGVILLSWIPILGGFIAGIAGGWVARGWRGGLLAGFIPGAIASVLGWFWYEVVRIARPDFLMGTLSAPTFWGLYMTGMIIIVALGGALGGYLHSVRDEPRGSGGRIQVG